MSGYAIRAHVRAHLCYAQACNFNPPLGCLQQKITHGNSSRRQDLDSIKQSFCLEYVSEMLRAERWCKTSSAGAETRSTMNIFHSELGSVL